MIPGCDRCAERPECSAGPAPGQGVLEERRFMRATRARLTKAPANRIAAA